MLFTSVFLFASPALALSFPDASALTKKLFARKDSCPTVWSSVSKELTSKFLTGGQCNPDARAAIRLIFHDCGAWNKAQGAKGGCDGSIALNAEENSRAENKGLEKISADMVALAAKYKVTVADMIVFAGNHAIVTCPGGPRVKTFIGRKDSTTAAPNGLLPDANADAASLSKLFTDKGFDDVDLAALLGAHTTSNQFSFDPSRSGASQDTTPGLWDVKYYGETLNPPAGIVVFPSDSKLARFDRVGKEFQGFVGNQGKWNGKFADAMEKMALFGSGSSGSSGSGSGGSGMVECTDSLPKSTNRKREARGMNPFMPRH